MRELNSSMTKGVIVVASDENDKLYPTLEIFVNDGGFHQEILTQYVFENEVYRKFEFDGASERLSYNRMHVNETIYHMVKQGFSVSLYDSYCGQTFILMYLPSNIGEVQAKKLKSIFEKIEDAKCYVSVLDEKEEFFDLYFGTDVDITTLMTLFDDKKSINQRGGK